MTSDALFLDFSARKLRHFGERIRILLGMLSEEQVWWRPGDQSNSVGNLCLHLAGNVRQWILHGVDGQPDTRQRDGEFAAREGVDKAALWNRLSAVLEEACGVIELLPASRLTVTVHPQNYDVSVLEAIYHVVEHFGQHTAQIIYITKLLTSADLGFYKHLSGLQPTAPPAGQETP